LLFFKIVQHFIFMYVYMNCMILHVNFAYIISLYVEKNNYMVSKFNSMENLWKLKKFLSTPPSQRVPRWLGTLQSGVIEN
jgi:hypothetical protein